MQYHFENKVAKKDNSIRRQFDVAVKIMQQLIEEGVANGEFFCDNPLAMARNIMFVIEGLKISSQTMGITEEMIDSEFGYIVQWLALEE